jgi:hypothetical protein
MHTTIWKRLAASVVVLWSIAGCKTSMEVEQPKGMLAGQVVLIDSTGVALPDLSGTLVTIDNTTLHAITDSSGAWNISDIPTGQYDVTAANPGFGTFHWYEQYVRGSRVDLQSAAIARMKDIRLTTHGVLDTNGLAFVLFSSPNVPIAIYWDYDSLAQPSDAHVAIHDTYAAIDKNDLRAAGAVPGQKLYVSVSTVYDGYNGVPIQYATKFYDPRHHHYRYASTGPKSNVVSFVLK